MKFIDQYSYKRTSTWLNVKCYRTLVIQYHVKICLAQVIRMSFVLDAMYQYCGDIEWRGFAQVYTIWRIKDVIFNKDKEHLTAQE